MKQKNTQKSKTRYANQKVQVCLLFKMKNDTKTLSNQTFTTQKPAKPNHSDLSISSDSKQRLLSANELHRSQTGQRLTANG